MSGLSLRVKLALKKPNVKQLTVNMTKPTDGELALHSEVYYSYGKSGVLNSRFFEHPGVWFKHVMLK